MALLFPSSLFPLKIQGKVLDSFSPGLVGFVLELLQDSITVLLDVGTLGFCIFRRVMKSAQCLSLNTKLVIGT